MFYTVYKITNTLNDKVYVGVHKTKNLSDNYMGSGTNIKRSIKKYGLENFKKEYLFIFDNEQDMFKMENEIVNYDFIKSVNTYNILNGGLGSWEYVNGNMSDLDKFNKGKWLGDNFGSKGGSWQNKNLRLKILESIPKDKRIIIGRNLGTRYGGENKLQQDVISHRLHLIENIDLSKYGWVRKASDILGISHTQTKRFIKAHYNGEYYIRSK